MTDHAAVLLFDGTCGFCARSVQFILGRERRRTLRFASLQSDFGEDVRRRHPELANVDSVIWYQPPDVTGGETVLVRTAAVLRVASYLGGIWAALGRVGALVPRVIRDAVYDFIARNRHRIIRGDASCLLPSPEQRARFIEWDRMTAG